MQLLHADLPIGGALAAREAINLFARWVNATREAHGKPLIGPTGEDIPPTFESTLLRLEQADHPNIQRLFGDIKGMWNMFVPAACGVVGAITPDFPPDDKPGTLIIHCSAETDIRLMLCLGHLLQGLKTVGDPVHVTGGPPGYPPRLFVVGPRGFLDIPPHQLAAWADDQYRLVFERLDAGDDDYKVLHLDDNQQMANDIDQLSDRAEQISRGGGATCGSCGEPLKMADQPIQVPATRAAPGSTPAHLLLEVTCGCQRHVIRYTLTEVSSQGLKPVDLTGE